MKRKAKEGKLDSSQPEGSLGIEKAREEEPCYGVLPNLQHGTKMWPSRTQTASNGLMMRTGRLDPETPDSTEVCSHGPGCSCNTNEPSFHRPQQPPFTEHKHRVPESVSDLGAETL